MVGAPWASFWNRVRSRPAERPVFYVLDNGLVAQGEEEPGLRPTVLALSHLSAGACEQPSIRILCSSQRRHKFTLNSPLEEARIEQSVPGDAAMAIA